MGHEKNVKSLAGKYDTSNRYSNFGPILQSIEISGFRGIQHLELDLKSPITAISGLNGTGKSTIAQLMSCGYKKASTAALSRYYVKDFFPISAADPEPFSTIAKVVFSYCVERGAEAQKVTVSRKESQWSGYKRQPERACYYVGFTQFIPKVERRDFSVYGAHELTLGVSTELSEEASENIAKILSLPYENLDFTEVSHKDRTMQLAMAVRRGKRYSENHMGFGEGRVVYMVTAMESAPLQSLFVLEEPETSLHGDAQRRLARYLVDVCSRRGHQIVMTTHSSAILSQLNRKSVIYLRRDREGGLTATTGLSTYQIDSYLQSEDRSSNGSTICVEDQFAKCFATEILRICNADLLGGCNFITIGGGQEIPKAVELLRDAGLRAVGITDGDMNLKGEYISRLPGTIPPERLVFGDPAVASHFDERYRLDLDEVLASIDDHHDFSLAIARHASVEANVIATESCMAYVAAREPSEFDELTNFLTKTLGDRR
ncbi:conserved hypothetical protein (plasmid) [Rhodococcus jostii RHA1]|uniref:Uncharacterized protein n=1 Tax=Rhodococcus jostii (strain RHA1) TaxID=101510 RepID=Q0RV85_RHOJR|nr:AAA family ATPase [Rhodococcus jostii]ABH00801.1 conserved hypothetical protein [Rhodococcus jostii RHA1]